MPNRPLLALFLTTALGACSVELHKLDDSSPASSSSNAPVDPSGGVTPLPPATDVPTSTATASLTDPRAGTVPVKVYVHYMLTNDLGDQATVHIEAFDNQYFQGSPKAAQEIDGFHAQTGSWQDATLQLTPGSYYIRAYLTNSPDPSVPYELQGMQLVADAPVGVYGALGAAKAITVEGAGQPAPDPVDIALDQLFEKPGSEPPTDAKVRVELTLAEGQTVPDRVKIHIHLSSSADLAKDPAYDFTLDSAELMVTGRTGKAEFVSPSLNEGDYVVFAWADTDGNGYYDAGELAAMYLVDGAAQKVPVRKSSTQTVALALAPNPKLPTP